jgi:GABA(A) receptor-associated protein
MSFKSKKSFQERASESYNIMKKYPDKVPIICENYDKTLPNLDRKKYLVPRDITLAEFMYIIRKRMKLDQSQGIFIFVNEKMLPTSYTINMIYETESDQDGFLYITVGGESVFG